MSLVLEIIESQGPDLGDVEVFDPIFDSEQFKKAENRLVVHGCNTVGAFGRGFAKSVGERNPDVRRSFFEWYKATREGKLISGQPPLALGEVQYVSASKSLFFANCITQEGLASELDRRHGAKPFKIEALAKCLAKISVQLNSGFLRTGDWQVFMPQIGCDRGGASWSDVLPVISHFAESVRRTRIFVFKATRR